MIAKTLPVPSTMTVSTINKGVFIRDLATAGPQTPLLSDLSWFK